MDGVLEQFLSELHISISEFNPELEFRPSRTNQVSRVLLELSFPLFVGEGGRGASNLF